MTHFIARYEEDLKRKEGLNPTEGFEDMQSIEAPHLTRKRMAPVALLQRKMQEKGSTLSLKCTIQTIQTDGRSGLLSRVTYSIGRSHRLTSQEALHYAEIINYLLVHSQVFVVQDIDGDCGYSLRMDTLLSAPYNRRSIARFIDEIEQDINVLIHTCKSVKRKQADLNQGIQSATGRHCELITSCKVLPLRTSQPCNP